VEHDLRSVTVRLILVDSLPDVPVASGELAGADQWTEAFERELAGQRPIYG
jgi:hypothetical protein